MHYTNCESKTNLEIDLHIRCLSQILSSGDWGVNKIYKYYYKFLFYINFRNIQELGLKDFEEYLKYILPQTLDNFNLKQIKLVLLNVKCLVLCDEYDNGYPNDRAFFESLVFSTKKKN